MVATNLTKQKSDKKVAEVKTPPHSIEAEQAVLGGLMSDCTTWDRIVDKLHENDFYLSTHRFIYQLIAQLANRQVNFDVLVIAAELKSLGQLENAGGEVYLYQIVNNTVSAANIIAYASIVRERSILRQLITLTQEIAELAYYPQGRTSTELLNDAESKIFGIAEQCARGSEPRRISQLLAKATERVDSLFHAETPFAGLATGFYDLDQLTSGLQKGELIIVAGRPSMGKTTLVMNMAEQVAWNTKQPVLIFSMEMPGESLALRLMSSWGRIDQHKLRTGKLAKEDWPRISSAVSALSSTSMFIDDTPALTPGELRARARRLKRAYGQPALIVIDYLQLMYVPGTKENRNIEISAISRSLKALALELNVPVIALSQLNRSLEQRSDRRPMMSDLRESGAIEQDADVIIFIYRDEVYNKGTPVKNTAEIIIAKHRNGPTGVIKLTFQGQYTRFENFAPDATEAT